MRIHAHRLCVAGLMLALGCPATVLAGGGGEPGALVVDGVPMPGITSDVANATPNARPAPTLDVKASPTPGGIVHATFGETQVITIAKDQLNRIVTPFPELRVKRAGNESVSVEVDGRVMYVTASTDAPTSVYLLDAKQPEKAVALVLMPKAVMPADLTIQIAGYVADTRPDAVAGADAERAAAWEREQPYVDTVVEVFRALASGRIPSGFGLRNAAPGAMPACALPGLRVEARQVVEGSHLIAYIGRVTNLTQAPVEVKETGCVGANVLGVAVWPDVLLHPGESSELYVAVKSDEDALDYDRRERVGGAL